MAATVCFSDLSDIAGSKPAPSLVRCAPQVQFTSAGVGGAEAGGEGEAMVRGLQGTRLAVDEKLERSRIQVRGWGGEGGREGEDASADLLGAHAAGQQVAATGGGRLFNAPRQVPHRLPSPPPCALPARSCLPAAAP